MCEFYAKPMSYGQFIGSTAMGGSKKYIANDLERMGYLYDIKSSMYLIRDGWPKFMPKKEFESRFKRVEGGDFWVAAANAADT